MSWIDGYVEAKNKKYYWACVWRDYNRHKDQMPYKDRSKFWARAKNMYFWYKYIECSGLDRF